MEVLLYGSKFGSFPQRKWENLSLSSQLSLSQLIAEKFRLLKAIIKDDLYSHILQLHNKNISLLYFEKKCLCSHLR